MEAASPAQSRAALGGGLVSPCHLHVRVGVPVRAVGLRCVADAASDVDQLRDGLDVVRVDAVASPAQVIGDQAVQERSPVDEFPGDTMCAPEPVALVNWLYP